MANWTQSHVNNIYYYTHQSSATACKTHLLVS